MIRMAVVLLVSLTTGCVAITTSTGKDEFIVTQYYGGIEGSKKGLIKAIEAGANRSCNDGYEIVETWEVPINHNTATSINWKIHCNREE